MVLVLLGVFPFFVPPVSHPVGGFGITSIQILFNPDNEFPGNHNISLFLARKNIQITVDNNCIRNSECLFMHANERRYHTEFVE